MQLKTKLILSFAGVLLIFLVSLIATIAVARNALVSSIEQESKTVVRSTADRLDTYLFQHFQTLALMLRRDTEYSRAIEAANSKPFNQERSRRLDVAWQGGDRSLSQIINDNRASMRLRRDMRLLDAGIAEIFLTDSNGLNIAQTNRTSDYLQSDEEWWQQAWNNGMFVGDAAFDQSARVLSVELALRWDAGSGPVGVLKAVLLLKEIQREIDELAASSRYENVMIELIDRRGELIYRGRQGFDDLSPDDLRSLDELNRVHPIIRSVADSRGHNDFPGSGWTVALLLSQDEVFTPARAMIRIAITLGVAVLLLAALLVFLLIRSFTEPLNQLSGAVGRIRKGNISDPIVLNRSDELGDFADALDKMRAAVRTSHDKLQSEIDERTRAEERYRLLFSATADLVLNLDDHNWEIRSANPASRKHLGRRPNKLGGVSLLDLVDYGEGSGLARAALIADLNGFREKKEPITRTIRFRRASDNGLVWMSARLEYVPIGEVSEVILRATPLPNDPLVECLDFEILQLRLPNDIALVTVAVDRLVATLHASLGPEEATSLGLALREMVVNAIEHGNLAISHAEKSEAMASGNYFELFRERQRDERYADRRVTIEYRYSPERVTYTITDEGDGFDFAAALLVTDEELRGKDHGRGIKITHQFFDEVEYEGKGNRVRLTRSTS